MAEELVGRVTHYYGRIGVAAVLLSAPLKVGERIWIVGRTTDLEQEVASLELDHRRIAEGLPGQEVGLLVVERVREGDRVYRLS